MKLNTVELDRLLPLFMREDQNFKAICYALESEIKLLHEQTNLIRLYKNIDTLPEEVLDELAWQFNSIEYSTSYDIEIKRTLIKNCLSTHHRRGTVASVEEIATKIFGNATVSEWFEYGGKPYHFKVTTSNIEITDKMIIEFNRVIKKTQNIRSHLEEVITELMDSMDVYYGGAILVDEKINLYTSSLGEYEISGVDLCITDGRLSFNLVASQEQKLIFKDVSTDKCYIILYEGSSDGLVIEEIEYDNPLEYLTLKDLSSNVNYKVFVNNGQLFYEEIN